MPQITSLYTDGACSGNPGPGGWGVVVYFNDGGVQELGGGDRATTNNRMEMQAAIDALQFFIDSAPIDPCVIHTDSEYTIKGITQWVKGWKKKGWKTAAGKDVLNQDLWEKLDTLNNAVEKLVRAPVVWKYVRGHSGNVGNERCDTIARGFAQGRPPQLQSRRAENNQLDLATDDDALPLPKPPITPATPMPEEHGHHPESIEHKSREEKVAHLQQTIASLRIADEIAQHGYFIASSELADLMDVNASAVTSRGDTWAWRNWIVSRVRREGNQILWQLERADGHQEHQS
jgi:ribonuclease HI